MSCGWSGDLTVTFTTTSTKPGGTRIGTRDELNEVAWDDELVLPGAFPGELVVMNCPVNFRIPAYYCRAGQYRVVVVLRPVGAASAISGGHYTWRGDASFHDVRAPRMLAIPVDWTDATGTVRSPTDASMLSSIAGSAKWLPFPYFSSVISALRLSSSLTFGVAASNGGCNPAFLDLDTKVGVLQIFAALAGGGDVVGFVPTAALPAPGTPYNSGCGITAIGTFVNDPQTLAHEIGHRHTCEHVAPAPGPVDPKYPKYPGPTGSIGYVGIDTTTSPPTMYSPVNTFDLMTYARGRIWISPYSYQRIFANRFSHQSERADPRVVRRQVLVTRVRLLRDGSVDPAQFVRLETSLTALPELPGRSPLSVDVLDREGRVLSTQHLRHLVPQGCGCGPADGVPDDRLPWRDLTGVVEVTDDAARLSFHAGGEPLLVIDAGEPPSLELAGPQRHDGTVRLGISATHPRETPAVVVFYSGDDGESWTPVAHDPGDVVELDKEHLPSRGTGRFRVVATAELVATTVESEPFDLAPAPIRAHLVLPDSTCGSESVLSVLLDLRGHDAPLPTEVAWRSDLDGDLGRGFAVPVALSDGRHEVVVSVPDGLGGVLEQRGIIVIGG